MSKSEHSAELFQKVYKASARAALERDEFAEFVVAANKLLTDHIQALETDDWIVLCLLLFYASSKDLYDDLRQCYYSLPKRFIEHHRSTVIMGILAMRDGVIPRLVVVLDEFDRIPSQFKSFLYKAACQKTKENFLVSHREFPATYYEQFMMLTE